jgi:hypothetical protein
MVARPGVEPGLRIRQSKPNPPKETESFRPVSANGFAAVCPPSARFSAKSVQVLPGALAESIVYHLLPDKDMAADLIWPVREEVGAIKEALVEKCETAASHWSHKK